MKTGAREEHALARTIWRRLRPLNRFVIRRIRQGWGPRRTVLLLTTTGRRSGLPRVTPLQFEEQDGLYYVASGRGMHADWVRNLTADPAVLVEVKGNQFPATAELESHPQRIAEFLTLRLRRHPIMVRAIMTAEGLPLRYSPQDLVDFASQKAMVVLRPDGATRLVVRRRARYPGAKSTSRADWAIPGSNRVFDGTENVTGHPPARGADKNLGRMQTMATMKELTTDFLAQKRIAVAGVSRTENDAANGIYRKLRDHGYTVFAVNPNAETVEGDPCYPDLMSIPGGVDGVVIVTTPTVTEQIVRQASEAGVPRVWMHKNFAEGSTSDEAVRYCQEHGIAVIPAGCPMMFCAPDFGHRCMKWVMQMTGKLPN